MHTRNAASGFSWIHDINGNCVQGNKELVIIGPALTQVKVKGYGHFIGKHHVSLLILKSRNSNVSVDLVVTAASYLATVPIIWVLVQLGRTILDTEWSWGRSRLLSGFGCRRISRTP